MKACYMTKERRQAFAMCADRGCVFSELIEDGDIEMCTRCWTWYEHDLHSVPGTLLTHEVSARYVSDQAKLTLAEVNAGYAPL